MTCSNGANDPAGGRLSPRAPGKDPYGAALHDLALRERDRILDLLNESTVLSNRAKLIDAAVALAGTASAE